MTWWVKEEPEVEVLSSSNPLPDNQENIPDVKTSAVSSFLAESSPKLNPLLNRGNQDLEPQTTPQPDSESVSRLNPGNSTSNTETAPIENSFEARERGRKLSAVKQRGRSRSRTSRSITPFRIRDNLSTVFGWNAQESDDDFEGELSKISLLKFVEPSTNKSKIPYSKPSSKLAVINNDQNSALNFELNTLKSKMCLFPCYYKWNVLLFEFDKSKSHKTIEYLYELSEFERTLNTDFKKYDKIKFFRENIILKRKDNFLVKSCSIDIKLFSGDSEFASFAKLLNLIIDGNILAQPFIDLSIIGMEFKRKTKYSIFSIWLYPPIERFDESSIFNPDLLVGLIDCIKDNLPEYLQSVVNSAVIVENETLETTGLYQYE